MSLALGRPDFFPFGNDREAHLRKGARTRATLDFPAGRLRDRALFHEYQPVKVELVLFRDRLSRRGRHFVDVERAMVAVDLLNDDETFLVLALDRNRCSSARTERGMAALDGELDVLRVVIAAADDDQIFEAARDEELAVAHEAEVPRPQIPFVAITRGGRRLERPLRLVGEPPIASGNDRPSQPDLPDFIGTARDERLGVDDENLGRLGGAATDEGPRVGLTDFGFDDAMARELARAQR